MGKTQLYTEEKIAADEEPVQGAPPVVHLPTWRVILLNLSYFGVNVMYLVLCVEAVPAQIEAMVGGASKGRWLGGMVGGGAVLMFIAGPLVGMQSDRMESKFGKRRPIMFIAAIFICLSLTGMAFSAPELLIQKSQLNAKGECKTPDLVLRRCSAYENQSLIMSHQKDTLVQDSGISPSVRVRFEKVGAYEGDLGLFISFFLLVMVSEVAFMTPYNALVADLTPVNQRGLSSGVMGFMVLLGNVAGAALGMFITKIGIFAVYGIFIAVFLACALITVFTTDEPPGSPSNTPIGCKEIFFGFWEPLCEHDFRWVFITRFFMQQGIATVTGFVEYWLADMVVLPHCWPVQTGVAVVLVPLLVAAAIGSFAGGVLSDRLGRRKPLIIIAAMCMFSVAIVYAFIQGPTAFYVAVPMSLLFGVGFGTYQSVDFALVMDVLPAARNVAKDLAVWHQALILPQALATPIGGIIVDIFERVNCHIGLGYIVLFLVAALYFLLSGLFVLKIRSAN